MSTKPDMIWQFVQFLKKDFNSKGIDDIEIYVNAFAAVNGRKKQRFVTENINLADKNWDYFGEQEWITKTPF